MQRREELGGERFPRAACEHHELRSPLHVRLGRARRAARRSRTIRDPEDRQLARRTSRLEERFSELEAREVETWGQIMDTLALWP